MSIPLRQPRGPSINSFAAVSEGPPQPDADALRRSNTVSTPRHHQPSASVSAVPSAAFPGSRYRNSTSRFRSGSLSSGNNDTGLVRRATARESVQAEEILVEEESEGKGLTRNSSLPSRRFDSTLMPPPRPPRRDYGQTSPTHAPSHSLSSLAMFSPPPTSFVMDDVPASVSRTQSLRAQAKNALGRSSSLKTTKDVPESSTLGRSSSLRGAEKHREMPFTPPTPPIIAYAPTELKRHHSLNQRRLDRAEPPVSPIGHSVWSAQAGEQGWGNVPLSDAFEAMNLSRTPSQQHVLQDEPSWVAGLVGQAEPRQWSPYTSPYMAYPTSVMAPLPVPMGPPPAPHPDRAVIELARSKGLNPASFNCRPPAARFFVIKSYTEDDVQKSLKHEIWSSTVLGNKRLDTAFRESGDSLPIYLLFSVNGSRHFCGVAQMLTPVDENQTSTVWAQDKWKGIFKLKWIFVRDVPSLALRHIRLIHTPEQKPITNSRDTQEVHYEAGCEVLQIFLDHQTKSKTSLLQDFAYYEQLSTQRQPQPSTTPIQRDHPQSLSQHREPLQPQHREPSQHQHREPSQHQYREPPQPQYREPQLHYREPQYQPREQQYQHRDLPPYQSREQPHYMLAPPVPAIPTRFR